MLPGYAKNDWWYVRAHSTANACEMCVDNYQTIRYLKPAFSGSPQERRRLHEKLRALHYEYLVVYHWWKDKGTMLSISPELMATPKGLPQNEDAHACK